MIKIYILKIYINIYINYIMIKNLLIMSCWLNYSIKKIWLIVLMIRLNNYKI